MNLVGIINLQPFIPLLLFFPNYQEKRISERKELLEVKHHFFYLDGPLLDLLSHVNKLKRTFAMCKLLVSYMLPIETLLLFWIWTIKLK